MVERLTAAILDLVELYCSTFNANFQTVQQSPCRSVPVKEAGFLTNLVSFNVYAAHRIPITWATRYACRVWRRGGAQQQSDPCPAL